MPKVESSLVLAQILYLFQRRSSWSEAQLMGKTGQPLKEVRRTIEVLRSQRWPFEFDPRSGWSLPPGWFPETASFQASDVAQLLRILANAPRSKVRDRLLDRLITASGEQVWGLPRTRS